jgi:predicted nucleic acid-binding Zn finger protein
MKHFIPAEVLQTFHASKGDNIWEVRKSHQDGKVYCTCPGWIFQARKKDGICKHIQAYLDLLKVKNPGATIQVYNIEEYNNVLALHRSMPALKEVKAEDILKLNRGQF